MTSKHTLNTLIVFFFWEQQIISKQTLNKLINNEIVYMFKKEQAEVNTLPGTWHYNLSLTQTFLNTQVGL